MSSIRVLVVDDSALMRKMIPMLIEQDPSLHVVGTAMDGEFALKKIPELHPDVVTLDLEMPRMDGIETLKQIVRQFPDLPVVVVSAHSKEGASLTFKALALGAFDFVAKPHDALTGHMDTIGEDLILKLKAATLQRASRARKVTMTAAGIKRTEPKQPLNRDHATQVVAIGVSTGGPNAVEYVLSHLPSDFPAAIVIVQHMPPGFTEMFARRLDETCAIDVKEAQAGDVLLAGRALVAPGDRHMKVRRALHGGTVVLSDDRHECGHRPSANVLFRSVAEEFDSRAVGILMTGMGEDGAHGLGLMKQAGALTLAQDEESCVVFGMPRAAIERGYAMRIASLSEIPGFLVSHFSETGLGVTSA